MAIYGNKWKVESATSVAKKEENIFAIESVVYDEYLNYKQLLKESVSDPILEAKIEVLSEVSLQDFKKKIKEIWERFKTWIKSIFENLFSKRKASKVSFDQALKKAKESLSKAKSKKVKLDESATILNESGITLKINRYGLFSVNKTYFLDNKDELIDQLLFSKYSIVSYEEDLKYLNEFEKILQEKNENDIKLKISDLIDTINAGKEKIDKTSNFNDSLKSECTVINCYSYDELISKIEDINNGLSDNLEIIDKEIKELKNKIEKYSNIPNMINNVNDPNVMAAISKLSNICISSLQKIINNYSKVENAIINAQNYYTEYLLKLSKDIDDKIAKFLEED